MIRAETLHEPQPHSGPASGADAYLNFLRFTAMSCRCKPRTSLFEACATLHVSRSATQQAYAEALMRCLGEALGKPPKLFAPGVVELSFDERWLMQLGIACQQGDSASLTFLIRSRVSHQHRRLVAFLVGQISENFATAY